MIIIIIIIITLRDSDAEGAERTGETLKAPAICGQIASLVQVQYKRSSVPYGAARAADSAAPCRLQDGGRVAGRRGVCRGVGVAYLLLARETTLNLLRDGTTSLIAMLHEGATCTSPIGSGLTSLRNAIKKATTVHVYVPSIGRSDAWRSQRTD